LRLLPFCVKNAFPDLELASKFNPGCVSHLTRFGEYPLLTKPPDKRFSLHVFQMESCVMSEKLLVNLWGASISADGVWAIGAAVVIVVIIALARRRA
jgi:hypothetical protein